MKRLFLLSVATLAFIPAIAGVYNLKVSLTEGHDGKMAYLNVNGKEPSDSALITDSRFVMKGEMELPADAIITVDGLDPVSFILDTDTFNIAITKEAIPGGVRTKWDVKSGRQHAFNEKYKTFADRYQKASDDNERHAVERDFKAFVQQTMDENADNALGAGMAIQTGQPRAFFERHPSILKLRSVRNYLHKLALQEALAPGNIFTDFEVTHDGVTRKLSDVAGKGDYILVDFWASWCGPCIRSMSHLKELYSLYGSKNFKIIGVPINDKPQDSLNAAQRLELPWEIWANDSGNAKEKYLVEKIPFTMLFAPDGKILLYDPSISQLEQYLAEIFK